MKLKEGNYYIITTQFYNPLKGATKHLNYLIHVISLVALEDVYKVKLVDSDIEIIIDLAEWGSVRPLYPLEEALL